MDKIAKSEIVSSLMGQGIETFSFSIPTNALNHMILSESQLDGP